MARIRSIKPEFWDDRKLARRACRDARLLYIALWNLADEHGRLNGDPQWIKGQVFPYDDDLDALAVAKLLDELEAPELNAVVAYEADGDPYLYLPKLARHQRLEPEKVKSRVPPPPEPRAGDPVSKRDGPQDRDGPSECGADESAPHADESALLYVAGGMEHVAGSRGAARGPDRAEPDPPPREPPGASGAPHEIPNGFRPSDEMLRWANSACPGLNLDFETDQFRRHFQSTGAKRKSWPAAWQKWVADSHERMSSTRASPARVAQSASDRAQVQAQALKAKLTGRADP